MCGGRCCGLDRSRHGHRNRGLVVGNGGGLGSHRWGLWLGGFGGMLGCRGRGLGRRDILCSTLGYVQ
jgi:hypothetical protein